MEKSCSNCKYKGCNEYEHPCVSCSGTALVNTKDYENRPYLWEDENDVVNHPSHYCQEGSMECIDEMIALFGKTPTMHFCLLNAWKYRKRAVYKNGEEDMKKSDWYINKYIELGGKAVKV